MYSSTCFGRPHAHHQELNNCRSSLLFYLRSDVIAVLLVVVGIPDFLSFFWPSVFRSKFCIHFSSLSLHATSPAPLILFDWIRKPKFVKRVSFLFFNTWRILVAVMNTKILKGPTRPCTRMSWYEGDYKMSLLPRSVDCFRHFTGRQRAIKHSSKMQYFMENCKLRIYWMPSNFNVAYRIVTAILTSVHLAWNGTKDLQATIQFSELKKYELK
jgi:hypothetical protein